MLPQNLTYEQALEQLKQIVNEIEQGNVSVEKLSEKIKKARELFEFCINRLSGIETEVAEILKNFPDSLDENS